MPEDLEINDSLPEDLQATYGSAEYQIPNNDKRRLAGYIYIGMGIGLTLLFLLFKDSALINEGIIISGVCIVVFGFYNLKASVRCEIDETDAVSIASKSLGFPIGPASAQLMWRGFRSRPTWRLLAYSNEKVPLRRALVLIDASTGEVLEQLVGENPEDWAENP